MLKSFVHTLGRAYIRRTLWAEYQGNHPDRRGPNERTWEYAFALAAFQHTQYQDVLDVGTGNSAWPSVLASCGYKVSATDEMGNYWNNRFLNHHYFVLRHDITAGPMNGHSFGAIHCLSVLEHIPKPDDAVAAMSAMLKPNGILVMTFPYNENKYVPNAYDLDGAYGKGSPYICQVYSRRCLNRWSTANKLSIIEQHYLRAFEGEFWACGKRLKPMVEVERNDQHHLTAVVLRLNSDSTPAF
jgi:SAM-dependent methyltransferase